MRGLIAAEREPLVYPLHTHTPKQQLTRNIILSFTTASHNHTASISTFKPPSKLNLGLHPFDESCNKASLQRDTAHKASQNDCIDHPKTTTVRLGLGRRLFSSLLFLLAFNR